MYVGLWQNSERRLLRQGIKRCHILYHKSDQMSREKHIVVGYCSIEISFTDLSAHSIHNDTEIRSILCVADSRRSSPSSQSCEGNSIEFSQYYSYVFRSRKGIAEQDTFSVVSPSICNVISMVPALEGLPHTLSHVSDCCVSFLHKLLRK